MGYPREEDYCRAAFQGGTSDSVGVRPSQSPDSRAPAAKSSTFSLATMEPVSRAVVSAVNAWILDANVATSLEHASCVPAVRERRLVVQNTAKLWMRDAHWGAEVVIQS